MELLYLWIDHYKNIRQQGFNFDPQLHFEYDEDILTITRKNDDWPKGFYGSNILNVTGIIGKNGSGKSSLLEFIVECYGRTSGSWTKPFILIYRGQEGIEILKHTSLECTINPDVYNGSIRNFADGEIIEGEFPFMNDSLMYYSNIYDGELRPFQRDSEKRYIDLSTNWRVTFRTEYAYSNIDPSAEEEVQEQNNEVRASLSYNALEMQSQIHFIVNGGLAYLDCQIPDIFEVSALNLYDGRFLINVMNDRQLTDEQQDQITAISDALDSDQAWAKIKKSMFFAKASEVMSRFTFPVYWITRAYQNIVENDQELSAQRLFSLIPSMQEANAANNPFQQLEAFFLRDDVAQFIQGENYRIPSDKIQIVSDLFTHLQRCDFSLYDPLAYSWKYNNAEQSGGLSTGEKAFLSLFSRIYDRWIWFGGGLILLDEAELGFHPEWQRHYLKRLLFFINQKFRTVQPPRYLQIILTSHSPFLISDLLKDNIIFLDKDQKGLCKVVPSINQDRTFAANIHNLFADSFFLNEGLIGEFAKAKVQNIIDWLNGKDNGLTSEKSLWLINKIGEPIVRSKLLEMYYEKKKGQSGEIQRIDEQIQELESLKARLLQTEEE